MLANHAPAVIIAVVQPTPPIKDNAPPNGEPILDASDRLQPLPLDANPKSMEAAPQSLTDDAPAVIAVYDQLDL